MAKKKKLTSSELKQKKMAKLAMATFAKKSDVVGASFATEQECRAIVTGYTPQAAE